jgi:hypothetical protein
VNSTLSSALPRVCIAYPTAAGLPFPVYRTGTGRIKRVSSAASGSSTKTSNGCDQLHHDLRVVGPEKLGEVERRTGFGGYAGGPILATDLLPQVGRPRP